MRRSEETTDEQFDRLPKHAQTLIRRLEREATSDARRIADLEAELRGDLTNDAKVSYQDFRTVDLIERPLPGDASLHFRCGPGRVRVGLRMNRDGREYLDVSADQSIIVVPTATNCIQVRHVERGRM